MTSTTEARHPGPDVRDDADGGDGNAVATDAADRNGAEAVEATPPDSSTDPELASEYLPAIEAIVFAADAPIPPRDIRDILFPGLAASAADDTGNPADGSDAPAAPRRGRRRSAKRRFTDATVADAVARLNTDYRKTGRTFRIVKIAGGYTFQTVPDYGVVIGRLFADRARRRLTSSALETLAIVAFKQPISKTGIESIRGVNADSVLKSLLERDLVTIVGRDTTVGRPLLYATTPTFLRHFGLDSLDSLPKPREIEELLGEGDAIAPHDDAERGGELHITPETEHLFESPATTPSSDDDADPPFHLSESTDMALLPDITFDARELPLPESGTEIAAPMTAEPRAAEPYDEDDDFDDDEFDELPEELDGDDLDEEDFEEEDFEEDGDENGEDEYEDEDADEED